MPFPGAETAFPCVGGRQAGIPPVLGAAAITGGISGEEIPGDIWAGFYRPSPGRLEDSRDRKPSQDYLRFFVETVPKRYAFGTGAPRKGWIWCSWNERQNVGAWTKLIILRARRKRRCGARRQLNADQEFVVLRQSSLTEWLQQVWDRGNR
jgi:hypothetical protein